MCPAPPLSVPYVDPWLSPDLLGETAHQVSGDVGLEGTIMGKGIATNQDRRAALYVLRDLPSNLPVLFGAMCRKLPATWKYESATASTLVS